MQKQLFFQTHCVPELLSFHKVHSLLVVEHMPGFYWGSRTFVIHFHGKFWAILTQLNLLKN